jgi:hypothetical protein
MTGLSTADKRKSDEGSSMTTRKVWYADAHSCGLNHEEIVLCIYGPRQGMQAIGMTADQARDLISSVTAALRSREDFTLPEVMA